MFFEKHYIEVCSLEKWDFRISFYRKLTKKVSADEFFCKNYYKNNYMYIEIFPVSETTSKQKA